MSVQDESWESALAALDEAKTARATAEAFADAVGALGGRASLFLPRPGSLQWITATAGAFELCESSLPGELAAEMRAKVDAEPAAVSTDLAQALGLEATVPAVVRRVVAGGRPVLVAYIDFAGEALGANQLDRIAELTRRTAEVIDAALAQRRRSTAPPAPVAPPKPPTPGLPKVASPPSPGKPGLPKVASPPAPAKPAAAKLPARPAPARPDAATVAATLPATARPAPPPAPPAMPTALPATPSAPPKIPPTLPPAPVEGRRTSSTAIPVAPPSAGGVDDRPADASGEWGAAFDSATEGVIDTEDVETRAIALDHRAGDDLSEDELTHVRRAPDAPVPDVVEAARRGDSGPLRQATPEALDAVFKEFPGELVQDQRDDERLPDARQLGPLLRAVIEAGGVATPRLVEGLTNADAKVRFYSALCFASLRDERCVPALVGRVLDPDPNVSRVCAQVLSLYRDTRPYLDAVRALRSGLKLHQPTFVAANVRALGYMGDTASVAELIELLAHAAPVGKAAHIALTRITGRDFGGRQSHWRKWHRKASGQHRVSWLTEAATKDRKHASETAASELERLTAHKFAVQGDDGASSS